jgi:hypothetical protein
MAKTIVTMKAWIWSGANPTIGIYNATGNLARFGKKYYLLILKTL